jgi:hypothetical protein
MTEKYPILTEENRDYVISIMMMDLVDILASNLPKNIDPRAWQHLLIYCPAEHIIDRLETIKENSSYVTQFDLENY